MDICRRFLAGNRIHNISLFPLLNSERECFFAHWPVVSADYDLAAMGEAIADFLVLKGRKKLLGMAGVRDDPLRVNQLAAIRKAMEDRGLALPENQIVTVRIASAASVYSTDLRDNVARFFRSHEDFDAVYSAYSDQFDVLTEMASGTRVLPFLRCLRALSPVSESRPI